MPQLNRQYVTISPRRGPSLKKRLEQWLWTLGTLVLALVPTWIWLIVYKILDPSNFIEKFLVFGAGVWIGGGIQVFALIAWAVFLVSMVWD